MIKMVKQKEIEINKMITQVSSHINFNEIYSSKVFKNSNIDSLDIYYPKNWLIATSKGKHCLMVFDKSNLKLLGTFGKKGLSNGQFNRPNGICIVDDFCFVVERDNKRIQVLKLPNFKTVSTFGKGLLKLPYGIDVKNEGDKRYVVFVTDSPKNEPMIYKLIFDSREFKVDTDFLIEDAKKVESILYDQDKKILFYADEVKRRMYGYDLKNKTNVFVSQKFKDEPEGIGLYNDQIIQVEQSKYYFNKNKFHVYERKGMRYLGYFTGNFTKNTDGIRMCNDGKLFAVDDDKRISCIDFKNEWKKSNLLVSYRSLLHSVKENKNLNTSMFMDLGIRRDVNFVVRLLTTFTLYEPPSKDKATWIIKRFIRLMNKIYEDFVPYSINKRWEVTFKRTQKVRNCATLYIILKLQRLVGGFTEQVMENVKNDMDYYIELYESHNRPMRQASAFLGLAIKEYREMDRHIDKKYFKILQKICEYQTKSLPKLESKFELGEVLIFLKEGCPPNYNLLLSEQQKMHSEIENDELERKHVFKYNWHAKYLFSLHSGTGYIPELRRPTELEKSVESHARFLADRLKKTVDRFVLEDVETNYLAVCFEACSALTMIDKNPFISINQDLMPTIGKLFGELNSRINDGGLFRFLSGGSRIDITGHVIEGLLYLFY